MKWSKEGQITTELYSNSVWAVFWQSIESKIGHNNLSASTNYPQKNPIQLLNSYVAAQLKKKV